MNVWYFGYHAGLDFNTPNPTVLTDGNTNVREGVSSISDATTGKLLFYTEGMTVWNARHLAMPNGTGLMGNPSSAQSAVAVPFPEHPGQYYLFTTYTGNSGFRYSIVDMSLDGGMGDIIPSTKNTLLFSASTEKMAATRHCNNRDYWIVSHAANSADFYVYLLTPTGLSTPTVYTLGRYISDQGWESVGNLKFSPDGKELSHTILPLSMSGPVGKGEFFKFDNKTGVLTGPTWSITDYSPTVLEYSLDGKYLYVVSSLQNELYQYERTAPDVLATKTDIWPDKLPGLVIGAIQMGPDGRIYTGYELGYDQGYKYVGRINKPNEKGLACNFVRDAVDLDPGNTGLHKVGHGFPTFMNSYLYLPADFTTTGNCTPTVSFKLKHEDDVVSVSWDFGDGATSTALAPSHTYQRSGKYNITLTVQRQCGIYEKTVEAPVIVHLTETETVTICSQTSYKLPDGRIVNRPGVYTSTITSPDGCSGNIITTLKIAPVYNLTVKATACEETGYTLPDGKKVFTSGTYVASFKTETFKCDSVITTELTVPRRQFDVTASICDGGSYELPDKSIVTKTGNYTVVLPASTGCDSVITTHLTVNPVYNIQESVVLCDGTTYQLPDGRMTGTAGIFTSKLVTYRGCDSTIVTTVTVSPVYHPVVDIATCESAPYKLPDGRIVSTSGTYVSPLKTYQGCDSIITTHLTVYPVAHTTTDTSFCNRNSYLLPDGRRVFTAATYISKLKTTHGCDSIVTTNLKMIDLPEGYIEPEVCITAGIPVVVTLPAGYDKYLWQDGSDKNPYAIRNPGIYRVRMSNACGTTELQTKAQDCSPDLYVPNAFSPNGDGVNEIFRIVRPSNQVLIEFRIYDRWGVEVFYTKNLKEGWNGYYKGQLQPVGAYVYFIRYIRMDGVEKMLKGTVTLVR